MLVVQFILQGNLNAARGRACARLGSGQMLHCGTVTGRARGLPVLAASSTSSLRVHLPTRPYPSQVSESLPPGVIPTVIVVGTSSSEFLTGTLT